MTVYKLMDAGHLKFVKIGRARRITVSPEDFLAALEAEQSAK